MGWKGNEAPATLSEIGALETVSCVTPASSAVEGDTTTFSDQTELESCFPYLTAQSASGLARRR